MGLLINGVDAKRKFTDIEKPKDAKYQLFVCLYLIGDSVEIINFTKN